jgi:hypothetical protein
METCGPFAAVIKQKSQEKLQGSQRPHPFTLINKKQCPTKLYDNHLRN